MISAPILLVAYGVWAYLFSNSDERLLLNPIFLSAAILLAMVEYFWRRDWHLPIVDVGVLCAFITLVYIAVPTIFYIKSGYHLVHVERPTPFRNERNSRKCRRSPVVRHRLPHHVLCGLHAAKRSGNAGAEHRG